MPSAAEELSEEIRVPAHPLGLVCAGESFSGTGRASLAPGEPLWRREMISGAGESFSGGGR
jgi:hypothetical protein